MIKAQKNRRVYSSRAISLLIVSSCFWVGLGTCCYAAFAQDSIKVALSSTPNSLSPFYATDANSQNIDRILHLGLTRVNAEMHFECELCTSFTQGFRGPRHILKFKLRNDVYFSDGEQVEAKHVKEAWKLYLNEKVKSVFSIAFSAIEDIKIISKFELEIIYKSFSLENLSNLELLKIIKIKNKEINDFGPDNLIGCGLYTLGSHGALSLDLHPREKSYKSLTFKVVKDETTLALKLIKGEIDISVSSMSPRKIFWLKDKYQENLNFFEVPSTNYVYIGFNHERKKFLDLNVRKALSILIPREDLLKYKMKGTVSLAHGLLSSAFVDVASKRPIDNYDPDYAHELFKKAGYQKDIDGFYSKEGQRLVIDWKIPNTRATQEIVESIKYYYQLNGIEVSLTIQEWGTFMKSMKTGQFDMIMAQWIGFTGPDMLKQVFHSSMFAPQGLNRGHYKNAELDKIIDLATVQTNSEIRSSLYKKAQKIAFDDYAYINLWHPNIIWITQKNIQSLDLLPNNSYSPILKAAKIENEERR